MIRRYCPAPNNNAFYKLDIAFFLKYDVFIFENVIY